MSSYNQANNEDAVDYEEPENVNLSVPYEENQHKEAVNHKVLSREEEEARCIQQNILFVSKYPESIEEEDLRKLFSPFGEILSITIRMSGISFVEFKETSCAVNAKYSCHLKPGLGSRSLIVDFKKTDSTRSGPAIQSERMPRNDDSRFYHNDRHVGRPSEYRSNGHDYLPMSGPRDGGPQFRDTFHPREVLPRGPPRDLPPRDYISRDLPPRDYVSRDPPPRDYVSRDLPPRDYMSRDLPPRDYVSRDLPPRGYLPPTDYVSRDFHRDYLPRESIHSNSSIPPNRDFTDRSYPGVDSRNFGYKPQMDRQYNMEPGYSRDNLDIRPPPGFHDGMRDNRGVPSNRYPAPVRAPVDIGYNSNERGHIDRPMDRYHPSDNKNYAIENRNRPFDSGHPSDYPQGDRFPKKQRF